MTTPDTPRATPGEGATTPTPGSVEHFYDVEPVARRFCASCSHAEHPHHNCAECIAAGIVASACVTFVAVPAPAVEAEEGQPTCPNCGSQPVDGHLVHYAGCPRTCRVCSARLSTLSAQGDAAGPTREWEALLAERVVGMERMADEYASPYGKSTAQAIRAVLATIAALRTAVADAERKRDEALAAHAASFGALARISALTALNGEVADYSAVVDAVSTAVADAEGREKALRVEAFVAGARWRETKTTDGRYQPPADPKWLRQEALAALAPSSATPSTDTDNG